MRWRLDLAYDGTDFSGWARQPGQRTVCGVIEEQLGLVLREPVQLTVAGRTDAGVHARGQVAHFDLAARSLDQRSIEDEQRIRDAINVIRSARQSVSRGMPNTRTQEAKP